MIWIVALAVSSLAFEHAKSGLYYDAPELVVGSDDYIRAGLAAKWLPRVVPPAAAFGQLRVPPRRIIDVFAYGGELDLLEVRLNTLMGVVDYHIVVETTFAGEPKPLYYADQRRAGHFAACDDRVRACVLERLAPTNSSDLWASESIAALDRVLPPSEIGDPDDTIVLFGAIDELPSPEALWLLRWCADLPPTPIVFDMRFYVYSYTWRVMDLARLGKPVRRDATRRPMGWLGTRVATVTEARGLTNHAQTYLLDSGWHCSMCQPVPAMRAKLAAHPPAELARNDRLLTEAWLLHVKRAGIDYALRYTDGNIVASNALREAPPYVASHAEAFEYMLFPPDPAELDGLPRERIASPTRTRQCSHCRRSALERTSRTLFIDSAAGSGETLLELGASPVRFGSSTAGRAFDRIVAFEQDADNWYA